MTNNYFPSSLVDIPWFFFLIGHDPRFNARRHGRQLFFKNRLRKRFKDGRRGRPLFLNGYIPRFHSRGQGRQLFA
jgi:hypothetical protein